MSTHKRVGVGGASCSAAFAVELARNHPEIHALLGLSGHTKVDGRAFLRQSENRAVLGVGSKDDVMMVKDVEGGEWVRLTAAESMQKVVDESTNPKSKLLVYENAGHATAMFENRIELESSILQRLVMFY